MADFIDGYIFATAGNVTTEIGLQDQIMAQAQEIGELRAQLRRQKAISVANRKTGQLVIEELRKLAPHSPLTNGDTIQNLGQQYFEEEMTRLRAEKP